MPDGAIIFDRAYFDKPEWLNQAKDGGFSRGAAWLDLLAITNQNATTGFVRGIQFPLERGECAWSKLALANRWGRSQGWVTTTLTIWEKDGRITIRQSDNQTTVIHVTNYDTWQTGLLAMLTPQREQNESRPRADREQNETEKGEGRREQKGTQGEKGEGSASTAPPRPITFEAVWKYFRENESGYTETQVYEQWLYYDAQRDPQTGGWRKPRGQTGAYALVTDWRSEMASALLRFAEKTGRENQKKAARADGRTPAMARFELSKKLQEVQERLDACHETGARPDVADEREERHLKQELASMEVAV